MGLLTPLAIRIGAVPWMPRLLPAIVRVDSALQRATRGRLTLLDVAGLPNLVLTVPGRKTGIARSTPLLCAPREGRYLVAGSNFGGPDEPAWVRNLEAAGAGELRADGRTHRFTSRRLDGAERAAAWAQLLRTWPNFALYERRTDRDIKVFELTPQDAPVT